MKKYLYFAGAALLGLASCAQEDIQPVQGDGNVNLTVSLPGNQFATRAFSDGYTALDLAYAVYDAETGNFVTEGTATFPADNLSTTVSLQLANGRKYNVAFFAYSQDQNVYTIDWKENKTISVDYTKMSDYNAIDYDAFYKLEPIEVVSGPIQKNVVLTRPFAQINWGTNDLANPGVTAADAYDTDAAKLVSSVTVKNVYKAFTVLDGKVAGDAVDVTFANQARPDKTKETFPVAAEAGKPAYEYLSMQYVLVDGGANTLIEATLTPARTEATAFTGEAVVVANLPVQRNYRTNIYGSLLTSPADFTITKDPIYATPDNNVEYVKIPAENFGSTTFDPAKSYRFVGTVDENGNPATTIDITKDNGNVTAAALSFENVILNVPYPMSVTAGRFGLNNVVISGKKAADASSNPTINVKNVESVEIDGLTVNREGSYNGLEIGLGQKVSDLKNIKIKNMKWQGGAVHNAICVYSMADGANITIEDSEFDNSNGGVILRLSNQTLAKNVTVNISNVSRTSWTNANAGRCDNALMWIQDITYFNNMKAANGAAGYFEDNNVYNTWKINLSNVKIDNNAVTSSTSKWTTKLNGNDGTFIGGFAVNNIGSRVVDASEWKADQHAVNSENAILLDGFGMDLVTNETLLPSLEVK